MDPHQFKTWIAFLLLIAAAIVLFHAISQIEIIWGWFLRFFGVITPFVAGFVIAYVLNIPRERFEKLLEKFGKGWVARRKRGLSVLVTYLVIIALFWLLLYLVFPPVYANIAAFVEFMQTTLFDDIHNFILELETNPTFAFLNLDFDELVSSINFETIMSIFTTDNLGIAMDAIVATGSFIFRAALAIVSSVYFMLEGDKVGKFFRRTLRSITSIKVYATIVKYGREINQYFKRYIFCQVLDAIILGTIMTIVLSIMGVSYSLALGPMLGFANLIPYFGSIIGTIAAFIIILVADGTTMGVIAGIVMIVIQQVDANFIFPRLLGGSLKISPLLVIIGISIGGAYYGIIGMIIAIPIATVTRNIIDDLLLYRESKKARGGEVLGK